MARRGAWTYEVVNDRGELLYLGKSTVPRMRFQQHRADKAWAREARRWRKLRWYPTEERALAAEEYAIRDRYPIMNIEHNEGNPYRVNPHTMRYAAGSRRGFLYRPELYADVHEGRWSPQSAPAGRQRRWPVTRCFRSLRARLLSWLGAWLLLTGALSVMLGKPMFVESAILLAVIRIAARRMFNR